MDIKCPVCRRKLGTAVRAEVKGKFFCTACDLWVCVVCFAKVLERDKRGIGLGGWSHVRFISESGYIIPSK